jgi:hypothetical protein
MPQYAIHRSAISAALPGVSKLASAFAGGDEAYRAAQDKEALNQSRIAQLSGLQSQQEAQAEHFTAQAENERAKTDVLKSRPGFYEEQSAIASNVDIPTIRAFRAQVAGQSPQVPMGPPTEGGQMGIGSFQAGPETRSKISLALQQFLPMLINSGDLKPDDLAQAAKVYHDIGLQNEVMDGRRTAASVNEAQRAVKGAEMFKQSGNGSVINPVTGAVDQTSPISRATVSVKTAQAAKAGAPPAARGKQPQEIDRDRVGILSQELNKAREGMKTATGADLVRLKADEAALVSELKNAGIKDLGQLAIVKPGKSAKPDAATQKVTDAQDVLSLLDEATPLLDSATHSYIGNAVDHGLRAVGMSTPGAQSAARLKAIEGLLVSKMPKMSGPQSDKDVLLYRQMAGQIGDATMPTETRKAALDTIRKINQRYASGGQASPLLQAAPSNAPTVGEVVDGYVFRGGEPSDPHNWAKAK